MPRPGPRPYECVRRAWHSDRHQPMRGSIIQQIFRFWVFCIFSWFLVLGAFLCSLSQCPPCVWLGSSLILTAPPLKRTGNGRKSFLSSCWKLRKSCTPKPILRFSLLGFALGSVQSLRKCGIKELIKIWRLDFYPWKPWNENLPSTEFDTTFWLNSG